MLPENHQVGSTARTQLLAPLLTSKVFHFLWVKEEFWIVSMVYNTGGYYKPKKGLSKHNRLQSTRKIGCKAHIILREYILYPDYNTANSYDSKHQERLAKEEQLKRLRADLQLNWIKGTIRE